MKNEEPDFRDAVELRKQAEEILKKKQKRVKETPLTVDVNKLLHELQVHQVELEMQNEELRQAYETAEIALKKYTMLYDLAPLGYLTLEKDGSICELNFTAADMLGEKRFSLINSNLRLYISESSKSEFDEFLTRVFTVNSKEFCEVSLGYDNNSLCTVYMEGIVTLEDQKCLLSIVDISKFKE
jgi:PAS domain-containing protein